MLMTYGLGEPLKFWATHKTSMAEDILQRIQRQIVTVNDAIYNEALVDLDNWVQAMGSQRIAIWPTSTWAGSKKSHYMREISYDTEEIIAYIADNKQTDGGLTECL